MNDRVFTAILAFLGDRRRRPIETQAHRCRLCSHCHDFLWADAKTAWSLLFGARRDEVDARFREQFKG